MIKTVIQQASEKFGTDGLPELRYLLFALATIGLLLAPMGMSSYYLRLLGSICFLATFAVTWDFFTGSTGYFSFAHMVLIGIAGYSSALLNAEIGIPLFLSIPTGALIACLFGTLLIAGPSLRLTGIYFTAITFILPLYAQDIVVLFSDITGGLDGYVFVTPLSSVVTELSPVTLPAQILIYYISAVTFIATVSGLIVISKSELGMVLRAVRQDELLLQSLGKNATKFKIGAFALIALITGFAGAVWTHFLFTLSPGTQLSLDYMIDIVIATTIGGIGTIVGPAIGVFLLKIVDYALVFLQNEVVGHPFGITLTDYRRSFTLITAILFFYLYPQGIYPTLRRRLDEGFVSSPPEGDGND